MDPKPVPGDWAGNGAPVKFSTRETREEGKGWFIIQEHLGRLQQVGSYRCWNCLARNGVDPADLLAAGLWGVALKMEPLRLFQPWRCCFDENTNMLRLAFSRAEHIA